MCKPFCKFLRSPTQAKWFVLQSVLILPLTIAGLELIGVNRLLRVMERLTSISVERAEPCPREMRTYAHLFSALVRRCPLPLKCLGRSVAFCWLMRWRGIDAAVHIGVRKNDQSLDAHAWVQVEDLVINDSQNVTERYIRVMPTYSEVQR